MIPYFLVLALLVFTFIFQLLWKQKITKKKTLIPPGPQGLPFFGNLLQFDRASPHIYLWRLANKYGPIMSMKLGSIPLLVISSPQLAKEALTTHDSIFCSRPQYVAQRKLSYNGLDIGVAPYSEFWRDMKKTCVVNLFSGKANLSFAPAREVEVHDMITKISDFASSHCNDPIDLSKILLSFTNNLICRTTFGKKFDDQEESEVKKFFDVIHEAQAMLAGFVVADYFPLFGWLNHLSGMTTRLKRTFEGLDSFYESQINEHLKHKMSKSSNKDILDILIELMEEQSSSVKLTPDHIKGILMNTLLGGTDTVAATIIWAMTALIKTPNVMKKAQAEIRGAIGNKGRVEEEDLVKLGYLRTIIKETLRLYPPSPILFPRETMKSCTIEGYEIQPKTLVYINAWAIGRDPAYWENPLQFWPERFLNGNHQVDSHGQDFEFLPFGAGRRGCPGSPMGLAMAELGLANLLYSFDWALPSGVKAQDIDSDVLPGITMHKKNALRLVPTKVLPENF